MVGREGEGGLHVGRSIVRRAHSLRRGLGRSDARILLWQGGEGGGRGSSRRGA